jgi:tetratricopeptide (TPR) repeat protein
MENPEDSDTMPVNIDNSKPNNKPKLVDRKGFWPLTGILLMLIIIILGVLIGVSGGINQRLAQEKSSALIKASEQFELGVSDLENGRFENAQQRFEYVLRLDPEYPGATDMLYQTLIQMNNQKTATPMPTLTPTPTATSSISDQADAEERFNNILALINDEKWSEAILEMDLLRKLDLNYRPVDVDGYYYIALRNRGVEKILQLGELEQGIYDLSLAERFAPLDKEADSFRVWARLYLTGASYWDVNWEQVVYYFSQIQPAFPNLRDGSGMTATERLRKSLIKYGDQIAATGDFCKAQTYYEQAFNLGSDPVAQPTLAWVAQKCWDFQNPTPIPVIETQTPTPTPTPEGWVPTEETPTASITP